MTGSIQLQGAIKLDTMYQLLSFEECLVLIGLLDEEFTASSSRAAFFIKLALSILIGAL